MHYDVHTHKTKNSDKTAFAILNPTFLNSIPIQDSVQEVFSTGIHPWYINTNTLENDLSLLEQSAVFRHVILIGECGLDKQCNIPLELQKEVFEVHVRLSERIKKPLIIHCVKAQEEIIAYKKKYQPRQPWIIHGFRGKPQQMEQWIKNDFFLSFGELFNENTVKQIPPERLLLETDDSSLTIQCIYNKVAIVRNISGRELEKQIEENVKNIFYLLYQDGGLSENQTDGVINTGLIK